jgi:hypothetical protein
MQMLTTCTHSPYDHTSKPYPYEHPVGLEIPEVIIGVSLST